ncbi:ATP-binding protein [Pseudogracilibacillus sp. SE30717A]|uniref:ATP-binding protein n=1 Tax=Pseudogracilibacillus sp. SE30717A TaxID=3098293 RepID=UPI00300E3FA5
MVSDSDVLEQYETHNMMFPTEIMNWYYANDKDSIVVIWNKKNEIIYVSQLIEQYFVKRVSDVIGKQWTSLMPKEQVTLIQNHFKEGNDQLHIPNIVLHSSQRKPYFFNGIVDKLAIEGECYYICKLKNITYINELKQVLLDSEKLILAGQLSAGLVHEIRNPLTSLKGFLQLVQAGVQQKEEYYKVMIGEIEKLEKITSELLHMAKPFKSKKRTEHVNKMIDDVLFIMSTQTNMRNVHFKLDLEEDFTTNCNASQIKQVLINLIKNGAEAMQNEGNITIRSRMENNYVAIDISDEGQGVPDDMLEQIKNPFFTTKQDGTGLGLVITHHILDIHQGMLNVTSSQDKGTTFTIFLPSINDK